MIYSSIMSDIIIRRALFLAVVSKTRDDSDQRTRCVHMNFGQDCRFSSVSLLKTPYCRTTIKNLNLMRIFKNLIKLRQKAFSKCDTQLYRYYRNSVNRERILCRSKFFFSKILQLKETKPKLWWKEIKRFSGMVYLLPVRTIFWHNSTLMKAKF